jgi:hypothetical protein
MWLERQVSMCREGKDDEVGEREEPSHNDYGTDEDRHCFAAHLSLSFAADNPAPLATPRAGDCSSPIVLAAGIAMHEPNARLPPDALACEWGDQIRKT